MADFYRPVTYTVNYPSGDVSQWFDILSGNDLSFIKVNMGRSANTDVEDAVLSEVGSYGRQLGRIGEALEVLIEHFDPKRPLTKDEQIALDDFRAMLRDIAGVKNGIDCA